MSGTVNVFLYILLGLGQTSYKVLLSQSGNDIPPNLLSPKNHRMP